MHIYFLFGFKLITRSSYVHGYTLNDDISHEVLALDQLVAIAFRTEKKTTPTTSDWSNEVKVNRITGTISILIIH